MSHVEMNGPAELGRLGLKIEEWPEETILLPNRKLRLHSDEQIAQIMGSISAFNLVMPILVDAKRMVIDGAAVLIAARNLGIKLIPVIVVSHLDAAKLAALKIALNKLRESTTWDLGVLQEELVFIEQAYPDLGPGPIGFTTPEYDLVMDPQPSKADLKADALPPLQEEPVSRKGDRYLTDKHVIMCGDATDEADLEKLMDGEVADMALTDSPWNLAGSSIGGKGKTGVRDFVQASGEMSDDEFLRFLITAFVLLAKHCRPGAIAFLFIDWRHMQEMLTAGLQAFGEPKNLCVWAKTSAGMGTFYRSQHELVFVFKKPGAKHVNNFELGQHGRSRSNIWSFPGLSSFGAGRDEQLALHPTVKPVAMLVEAIKDVSHRGDIVLDVFGGSGSTLIAAHKAGRRARIMELDPRYVDTICRRFEKFTGIAPVLESTGQTFAEVEAERRAPPAPEALQEAAE